MVSPKGTQPASAERRLAELGIKLPPAPTPLGAYVESVQTGNLLFLSGILPVVDHEPQFVGRLGGEYNAEQGREAAGLAALNVLSAARNHLGSLDKVTRVVKLTTYLATEGTFLAHPKVADALPNCCAMSLETTSFRSEWFLESEASHSECRSWWKFFSN